MNLRENWPERGLLAPVFRELNRIARLLNNVRGFDGVQVFNTSSGLDIYGTAGGEAFAFRITNYNGDEQILFLDGGLIQHGNGIFYLVPSEVSVTGNPAFVVMRVSRNDISDSSWLESTVSSVPADTPQYIYIPFYEFELIGGDPPIHSLKLIHHVGSVRV